MLVVNDPEKTVAAGGSASQREICIRDPVPLGQPASSARCAPPDRILILADDLTGACDSAVAFLPSGRTVRVLLDADAAVPGGASSEPEGILAITTESRGLPQNRAAEQVSGCISRMGSAIPGSLLFKKIDSAARGNFAVEIEAALRASGAALALVTPAFPAASRTVSEGILTVRDWSGQNTRIDLRQLFREVSHADTAVLNAASEEELLRAMARAVESGTRILLCDAAEQADLDHLAAAALRLAYPVLWAGSAGLSHALAKQLPAASSASPLPSRRFGHTLLFAGTPHPVTALQLAHINRASRNTARAIHRIAESEPSPVMAVQAFTARSTAALILTGGDTASFVLGALGAVSIRLVGEIATGIPWGIIEGGLAGGCTVVTKSGGFGERDALLRAFEFCESPPEPGAASAP